MRWIVVGTKSDGTRIEGTVDAVSEEHAEKRLKKRGIAVVSIVPTTTSTPTTTKAALESAAHSASHPHASEPAHAFDGLVFISHSSMDAGPANEIVFALESAGIKCWIAPRDIPPGSNWISQIMAGLRDCRALVLIYINRALLLLESPSAENLAAASADTTEGVRIATVNVRANRLKRDAELVLQAKSTLVKVLIEQGNFDQAEMESDAGIHLAESHPALDKAEQKYQKAETAYKDALRIDLQRTWETEPQPLLHSRLQRQTQDVHG